MILNKFNRFIRQFYETLCYECQSVFKIGGSVELIIFPALTINFALFRKYLESFVTPLTAQHTSKLTENEETLVDESHKAMEKA